MIRLDVGTRRIGDQRIVRLACKNEFDKVKTLHDPEYVPYQGRIQDICKGGSYVYRCGGSLC